MRPVRQAATMASLDHAVDGGPDKDGLVGQQIDLEGPWQRRRHHGNQIANSFDDWRGWRRCGLVDVISVPRRPSRRTILV